MQLDVHRIAGLAAVVYPGSVRLRQGGQDSAKGERMAGEVTLVRRKILLILSLAVISVGAASWWYARARTTAAAEFPADVLALMPGDASMIVYADVAVLREEPLVQRLAAMAPQAQPGTEYANFIGATGFEYQRDLDRVVLATRSVPNPQSPDSQTLVIADGRFDQSKIEAYALRSGKVEQRNGHTVYTTPTATPGKMTAFTFLAAGRVALADGGDVSSVLGERPQAPVDAALQEQISRVAGAPLFLVGKPQAILPAGGRAGGFSTPLDSLRWVNLAARPDGDRVLLSAEGLCDSPEQARQMATTLEFLRGLLRGMLADPQGRGQLPAETAQAISQMFQAAQISTEASRVRLLVSVDTAMLGGAAPPSGP